MSRQEPKQPTQNLEIVISYNFPLKLKLEKRIISLAKQCGGNPGDSGIGFGQRDIYFLFSHQSQVIAFFSLLLLLPEAISFHLPGGEKCDSRVVFKLQRPDDDHEPMD